MVHGVNSIRNCMKDRDRGPDIDWAVRRGREKVRGGHPNYRLCIVGERRSLFIVTLRVFAGGGAAQALEAELDSGGRLVGDTNLLPCTGGGTTGCCGIFLGFGKIFGGHTFLMPLTTFGFSCSTSGRVAAVSELQDLQEPRKFSAQVGLRWVGFRSGCDSRGTRLPLLFDAPKKSSEPAGRYPSSSKSNRYTLTARGRLK